MNLLRQWMNLSQFPSESSDAVNPDPLAVKSSSVESADNPIPSDLNQMAVNDVTSHHIHDQLKKLGLIEVVNNKSDYMTEPSKEEGGDAEASDRNGNLSEIVSEPFLGGDGEKKIGDGESACPVRPEAGDCAFYMKGGNCKLGSNCRFNHPVRKENPADKEKEKEQEEPGGKPSQAAKEKSKKRGESEGKPSQDNKEKVKKQEETRGWPSQAGKVKGKEKKEPGGKPNQADKMKRKIQEKPGKKPSQADKEKVMKREEPGGKLSQIECKAAKEKAKKWEEPGGKPSQANKEKVKKREEPGAKTSQASKEKVKKREEPGGKPSQANKEKVKKREEPQRKPSQARKEKQKEREDSAEKPGQTECKHYLKTGVCKFGKACRHKHSTPKPPQAPISELNFLGLPIRPGEKDCQHYMRNGSCKFGADCWFNHPEPTTVGEGDSSSGYGNNESVGPVSSLPAYEPSAPSWSSSGPLMFSPIHGFPSQTTEWNGWQAPVYLPERNMYSPEANVYAPYQPQVQIDDSQERPLSDKGLPIRPDQNICTRCSRYSHCNVGLACESDLSVQPPASTGNAPAAEVSGDNTQGNNSWN